MDRFFLAVMVSGLLLAAVSVSLLVATSGGERTASVMNLPSDPLMTTGRVKPRRAGEDRLAPRDDRKR